MILPTHENTLSKAQITAFLENKQVIAPQKDFLEEKRNQGISATTYIKPLLHQKFRKAHQLLTGICWKYRNI